MDLSKVKTSELVVELKTREGVEYGHCRSLSERRSFCRRSCRDFGCYGLTECSAVTVDQKGVAIWYQE